MELQSNEQVEDLCPWSVVETKAKANKIRDSALFRLKRKRKLSRSEAFREWPCAWNNVMLRSDVLTTATKSVLFFRSVTLGNVYNKTDSGFTSWYQVLFPFCSTVPFHVGKGKHELPSVIGKQLVTFARGLAQRTDVASPRAYADAGEPESFSPPR